MKQILHSEAMEPTNTHFKSEIDTLCATNNPITHKWFWVRKVHTFLLPNSWISFPFSAIVTSGN